MKILVTGSSGLVGSALVPALRSEGHEVLRLVRGAPDGDDALRWDPKAGEIDPAALDVDAVVHLAGAPIADKRWNQTRKAEIRDSRVQGTTTLAQGLAAGPGRCRTLICASAIGFYGERGDRVLDEQAPVGEGFLPDVCQAWEAAADPARDAGLRVAHMRLGVVLAKDGGALARMLLPFQLGLGGNLGSGRQWMSWISLDDAVDGFRSALTDDALAGPVNLVAPEPATNAQFTKALGRALHRPTVLPMPAFAARLAFGEVADALLLASTRVVPGALIGAGFSFRHPAIDAALADIVGRSAVPATV